MSEAWRCFVGVAPDEELRDHLAEAVAAWRDRADLAALHWLDPASWHLTLAFIGDVDPADVQPLVERIADAAALHESLRLGTGGLGAFPSAARARVAWYGVEDPELRLARLAADAARSAGVETDGPFSGHITLGRARGRPLDLRAFVTEAAPRGTLSVSGIELVRSRPGGGPANYETLVTIPLGGGSGGRR
ncbi:MAG: RNA 2',3'-cyclic phosphodiesterase [Candidatus Limnocylindria bacterium]